MQPLTQTSFVPNPVAATRRLRAYTKHLTIAIEEDNAHKLSPKQIDAAEAAGLQYVSDAHPGIRRKKKFTRGFRYLNASGKDVTDAATLARIRALAIPPAWKDVWICARDDGHLQATGFDARGRKQYRYHPLWRQARDLAKYYRMIPFGEALPKIRRRVDADLHSKPLSKRQVLATIVRLLEATLIRIGNDEYAKANGSYGLTTMRNEHVEIIRSRIRFCFRGKSGKQRDLELLAPDLAAIVKRCKALPGDELFQYVDDHGKQHDITAEEVNAYLRDISGEDFSAKDFRTWAGTVHAALALQAAAPCLTKFETKKAIVRAIEEVSEKLGNTPAVCRKAYVHPIILDSFASQDLLPRMNKHTSNAKRCKQRGLSVGEMAVLRFLKECLGK